MDYRHELKIPKDRISALIGTKGVTKRQIEAATGCRLGIDSKEGDIVIEGEDAINVFTSKEIVNAIGRGFNPELALLLLKQDYVSEILALSHYTRSKNDLLRIRGRIIGKEGRARTLIEEYTETYVCVYGKTVSLIGEPENVAVARKAIEALLTGSPHANVYKWLEKKRRDLKRGSIEKIAL